MPRIKGERGFATIATGDIRYYDIAANLLLSYRMTTDSPYPFAIIADRENEYTAQFDEVIVLENPSKSYNDKLKLYEYLPFEETIFIDADSLAYGDLNAWWEVFAEAGDFSAFGYANYDLKNATRWFSIDGIREFANIVRFVPDFNGGVYFLRNTDTCRRVFEIADYCAKNYCDYVFADFSEPADEPVLALGMAVCGCEPVNKEEILFAIRPKRYDPDILVPTIVNKNDGKHESARLIHWSNYLTRKSLYKFEVSKLKKYNEKSLVSRIMYKHRLKYWLLHYCDIIAFAGRVKRKIRKMMKQLKK